MAVSDDIKKETHKLKDMTFKQKITYILDYYKFYILAIIAIIIVVITFVHDYKENAKPTYIEAIIINSDTAYDDTNYFTEDFIKYTGADTATYAVTIDPSYVISVDGFDQVTTANISKLMAMYAANLDVVIGPDSILDEYGFMGGDMDLSTVLSSEQLDKLLAKGYEPYYMIEIKDSENKTAVEEDAVENGVTKDTPGAYIAGIYLDNSEYLKNMKPKGAFTTQLDNGNHIVFTIACKAKNIDNSVAFLEMITGVDLK